MSRYVPDASTRPQIGCCERHPDRRGSRSRTGHPWPSFESLNPGKEVSDAHPHTNNFVEQKTMECSTLNMCRMIESVMAGFNLHILEMDLVMPTSCGVPSSPT